LKYECTGCDDRGRDNQVSLIIVDGVEFDREGRAGETGEAVGEGCMYFVDSGTISPVPADLASSLLMMRDGCAGHRPACGVGKVSKRD